MTHDSVTQDASGQAPGDSRPKPQAPSPKPQAPSPKTQDSRPKSQVPRPKTQDPRLKTQDPRPFLVRLRRPPQNRPYEPTPSTWTSICGNGMPMPAPSRAYFTSRVIASMTGQ